MRRSIRKMRRIKSMIRNRKGVSGLGGAG